MTENETMTQRSVRREDAMWLALKMEEEALTQEMGLEAGTSRRKAAPQTHFTLLSPRTVRE